MGRLRPLTVRGTRGGRFDRDSELELWTRAGHIKVRLAKDVDIRRPDSLIAWVVLGRS